ncbi:hypothetical protein [Corynebacterium sp. p3-SID1056]|uniref:hypothetical protein n=1 Tax=Corynebacterium sp. p3-SID1056 TaxID=2916092 RepID=UPI0021A36496|nr:hypothetical protein [Corynebacterium sp. p3-SID1056]MCT2338447.1 hypothetical protein [Corynebacterium sp. p3-SID1056]
MDQRKDLMWQAIIGFVGFFALVALVQGLVNLFRAEPAIWPGLLAGAFALAEWWLVRRWLAWRDSEAL